MSDKIHYSDSSSNEIADNSGCNIAAPEVVFLPLEVQILSPEDIAHGALVR